MGFGLGIRNGVSVRLGLAVGCRVLEGLGAAVGASVGCGVAVLETIPVGSGGGVAVTTTVNVRVQANWAARKKPKRANRARLLSMGVMPSYHGAASWHTPAKEDAPFCQYVVGYRQDSQGGDGMVMDVQVYTQPG